MRFGSFIFRELSLIETNFPSEKEEKVQSLILQRSEKGTIYSGGAGVLTLELV